MRDSQRLLDQVRRTVRDEKLFNKYGPSPLGELFEELDMLCAAGQIPDDWRPDAYVSDDEDARIEQHRKDYPRDELKNLLGGQ